MPTFTPPTRDEAVGGDRLFSRYTVPVGMSVVKVNGAYTTTPYPWAGDLEGLTDGTDYFLGGRTYTITSAVAVALEASGYKVDGFGGYGMGAYGGGRYGE